MGKSVSEQISEAAARTEPCLTDDQTPRPGGVDPLGLRQINFDRMDQVFPGLNNVARHIRPFTVVTWAWRQAARIAEHEGLKDARRSLLRDFVDRIEVIYAWSQFLITPNADLPGRDVLAHLLRDDTVFHFGGEDWNEQCETRRLSTALSAPINYGPALRSLGWLEVSDDGSGALCATKRVSEALEAFEGRLSPFLDHPAFSKLGPVDVSTEDVRTWAEAWRLNDPSPQERQAMANLLEGQNSDPRRAAGVRLAVAAAEQCVERSVDHVRGMMCGSPFNFHTTEALAVTSATWRRVQIRQLFRLALEALFAWSIKQLGPVPTPTERIVATFLSRTKHPPSLVTNDWLVSANLGSDGPTQIIGELEDALAESSWSRVPSAIHRGLSLCLAEAPPIADDFEKAERLPLTLAAKQLEGWRSAPVESFLRHVFEAWLFGQHTYWSVGRGLADARSGGKALLRLRVVLEEGGWCLSPGASPTTPVPTADRLGTILSLASESELLGPATVGA